MSYGHIKLQVQMKGDFSAETLKDTGHRSSLAMALGDRAFLQAQKAMWPQPSGSIHYSPILGASGLQSFLAVVAAPWPWTRGNEGEQSACAKWPVRGHVHGTGEAAEDSWRSAYHRAVLICSSVFLPHCTVPSLSLGTALSIRPCINNS